MMTFKKLSKRPRVFQRMTGLTTDEFQILLDKFQSAWQEFVGKNFLSKDRKRKYGGGRHTRLLFLEDKLLFILVYTRIYPLMVVQGLFFGFEDSRACEWVGRLLPLLDKTMGYAHSKPRRGHGRSLDEILEEFPELREFGITSDGAERPVRRPKNPVKQKDCYSGKKKRHTKKNFLIVHPKTSQILYLSRTRGSRMHDKKCADKENISCHDPTVKCISDLGLQGLKIGVMQMITPKKNTKLHKLSDSDKAQNRLISSIRVIAEHAIAGAKRNHSVSDTCRNIKDEFDDLLMSVACGLHNFRTIHRQYA